MPSNNGCFICLETSPPPIQMGCACRGEAGLAHLGCLAKAAESRAAREGWWKCRTCNQGFTGAMQRGLAEELWLRSRDQPAESEDRQHAAWNLANALRCQGKYAEAAQMQHELLDMRRRVPGPEHPITLGTISDLALSLCGQGKYAEAEQMQRELLDVRRRVLGPEHPNTLTTMSNLCSSLRGQGKYTEAEQMRRELLIVMQRVLGPDHRDTLITMSSLALSLSGQGKHAEAEQMLCDVLDVQRRVLGPDDRKSVG